MLAVALSALVLMIFNLWFAPQPQPPAPTMTGDEPGPRSSQPPALVNPGGDAVTERRESLELPPMDEAVAEETATVRTGWVEASFTNRGGQLLSWRLVRYHELSGTPVSLVRGPSELGLVLETPQGMLDLRNVLFSMRETTGAGGAKKLTFEATTASGLQVVKTYTMPADGYMLDLDVEIRGAVEATAYRLTWDHGIPPAESSKKQYESAAGTIVLAGKDPKTQKPGDFKKEREKDIEGNIRWAGVRNKYFMAVMVPPEATSSKVVATGDHDQKITGAELVMPLVQGRAQHQIRVYLGPMEYDSLKDMGYDLEKAVDLGWKVFRPLSKLLLLVMVWMYQFIPNYGLVIVIISVATKFLFYPLTKSSLKSMKAMQKLQPEMQAIRDKYKGDPQRTQAETMKLYREHGVNPVGGCLPMLVQMPVFVALYSVLANSITMRQAPFVGWINDLSTPDTVAVIAGFGIHVLPIVMFFTTILQQKLTPMTDARQKMMGYMMPAVMLFIFYSFPAGLTLYWTINNALQVGQQWLIHREDQQPVPA